MKKVYILLVSIPSECYSQREDIICGSFDKNILEIEKLKLEKERDDFNFGVQFLQRNLNFFNLQYKNCSTPLEKLEQRSSMFKEFANLYKDLLPKSLFDMLYSNDFYGASTPIEKEYNIQEIKMI